MKKLRRIRLRMAIALAALWMGMGVLPSANAQRPFVVQGELTGLPDGTGFLLMSLQGNYGLMVDGTSSRKGRFRLQGVASEGCMFKLQLTNEVSTMHFLDLWVQDGDTVTIRGNSKYSFDWVVTSTNPMQQEQTAYNDAAKKVYQEIAKQDTLIWKLTVRQHMASGSQAQRLKDSIAIANRSRDSLYAQVGARQFAVLKQLYLEDGKVKRLSPCAEYLLNRVSGYVSRRHEYSCLDEMRAFYKLIPEEQKQSFDLRVAGANLFPPQTVVKENDFMYDESLLYDLQGNQHRLSDYNKGKYLLLDFWGSGCGPCLAAFPELKAISEELADSLVVISISSDNEKRWRESSKENGITWVSLTDKCGNAGIFAHYGVNAIPFYVVISPEGKIVKTFTGYSEGRIKQKLSSIFPQYK